MHLGPPWAGEPGVALESHVAVIGGGDNAFDVSRMLIEKGVRATVVMRSPTPPAQPRLVARLRAHEPSGKAQNHGAAHGHGARRRRRDGCVFS